MLTVMMVNFLLVKLLLSATTDEALLQNRYYSCTVFQSFEYSPG